MASRSKEIKCDGETFPSVKEFSYYFGLNYSKVQYYFRRGKTPEEIISLCQFTSASKSKDDEKPKGRQSPCEYDGVKYSSLYEASVSLGFSPSHIYEVRKRYNVSASEAVAIAVKRREEKGLAPGYASKKCVVDGKEYPSREAAARAYHVPIITVYSRMEREKISFEEALLRGRNASLYCPPVSSVFPSLRLLPEQKSLRQPVLEDLQTSLVYYNCEVETMRDVVTKAPALRVDGHTYIYFNLDGHGLEVFSILPVHLDQSSLDLVNGAYAAAKVFTCTESKNLGLLMFQFAKEEQQDIKILLNMYFSFATIREKIIRDFAESDPKKTE